MCNAWAKYGECKNGDSCTYAHTHEALELARQRQLAKAQKKVSSPIDSLQFLHGSQPRLKPAKVSRFMNVFWHAADKSWGYDFGSSAGGEDGVPMSKSGSKLETNQRAPTSPNV